MILGKSVMADQGGHYVPRTQATMNAESFMGSLRANQNTGLIDPADMFKAMQAPASRNAADQPLYWISMGPDNMGGQTTAVVYDNTKNASGNPNGVVYIGSKGGGVYKTYNYGTTWHQVGDMNLMVSTMVQDKDGIIYVGTGDGGDNVNQNGLSQQGYDNSFIGTGIWAIDAKNGDATEQIVAPTADEWLYVNELALTDDKLIAATSEGLKYSTDKGATWQFARDNEGAELNGDAVEVKVGVDNLIVASVDKLVYIGFDIESLVCYTGTSNNLQGDTLLPKAAGIYDVTVSPTTAGVVYAATIDGNGNHKGIFRSDNHGANWITVLPGVSNNTGHAVYEGTGLYNHGLVVDPANDDVLYVLGLNLWQLQKPATTNGYYLCECLTANTTISSSYYIHVGMKTMVFNPNNTNEFYIGTNGGIYKGARDFSFYNCNRNYVTARMFSVGFGGKDARVLAAGLDHGTVLIEGNPSSNTLGSGLWINPTGDNQGYFTDASHAGNCYISSINPNTFFVTYKGDSDNWKYHMSRTETAGEDWVSTNFTSALSISTSSFRLPILLKEKYVDDNSLFTVWYHNNDTLPIPANTEVQVLSNSNFPFNYTLPYEIPAGDSIEIHDPISAKLYVTFTDALYVSLTPLDFGVESEWLKLAGKQLVTYSGEPLSMGISEDGDVLFVGFKSGKLYRISNLNTVVDSNTGTYTTTAPNPNNPSSNITILNPDCQVVTTSIALGTSQCVTSVSVDPRDANKVLVTLGNYGNEDYVLYSTNALDETPTFTSVQGDLPKMPVYSSLIEMETGDIIIGTERGIYRCTDIAAAEWVAENTVMGEVPVTELKQQTLFHEDEQIVKEGPDGIFITEYPGVHNTGVIYAATYGRGVFRCENYKRDFESVPETPAMVESTTVSMYPNPVRSQATVSFDVKDNANVNYQVFDLTGRMVMNQNVGRFSEGSHEFQINTENLSTGSYILRLNQNGNSSCVKFLVY